MYFYVFLIAMLAGADQFQFDGLAKNQTRTFYIGTYTDDGAKGIYRCHLTREGNLQGLKLVAETTNPSYLAMSGDGKYLVSTVEVNEEETGGYIESWLIHPDSLEFLSRRTSGGGHPCYVAVNEEGYVLTANYTGGTVGLHQLGKDGELSEIMDAWQHVGSGPHPRQDGPHAHTCRFWPGKDLVVTADLGTNDLWFMQIDQKADKLIPSDPEKLAMAPGAGPRHVAFHPNGNWIYAINELNSTVTQVIRTEQGYHTGQSVSTLPAGFSGDNYCADIHLSSDGKFLYGSNRGHHSIVTYRIDPESGNLETIGFTPVRGDWPRNFTLSPDENHLLVANRRSGNIVVFQRNTETGTLTYLREIELPGPVCILFAE